MERVGNQCNMPFAGGETIIKNQTTRRKTIDRVASFSRSPFFTPLPARNKMRKGVRTKAPNSATLGPFILAKDLR